VEAVVGVGERAGGRVAARRAATGDGGADVVRRQRDVAIGAGDQREIVVAYAQLVAAPVFDADVHRRDGALDVDAAAPGIRIDGDGDPGIGITGDGARR